MGPNKHTYYLSEETACKLIKEVKCRPCLWDPEDENYTNRLLCVTAWKEVAKNVGLTEIILRAKWKNLRDLFKKELKKFKTTSLSNYKGRWRYFQPLWFLFKICDTNFDAETQENDDQLEVEVDSLSNTEYLEESGQEDYDVEIDNFFQVESNKVDFLQEDPISERKPYADDDYDLMFLKSLMPYFRQLDSMRKLVLRSKIQDMLMNEIAAQNASRHNK
ncbi:uncharacterized protein LOC113233831 [Hyposmocoma kahamanoa]|uniref:uncharacterized protein LOC113233831 n=1 Tax=Hyposmocoma kahamanoa TaxID=1477025 RepID=UPI000E6DA517|nr:uncharacterized protein LOC113233831 [Hyposmocoma kahamanoa]